MPRARKSSRSICHESQTSYHESRSICYEFVRPGRHFQKPRSASASGATSVGVPGDRQSSVSAEAGASADEQCGKHVTVHISEPDSEPEHTPVQSAAGSDRLNLTMKALPIADQPYEKCMRLGATQLSDAELLAIIVRSGRRHETALAMTQQLLIAVSDGDQQQTGLRHLHDASLEELCSRPGIGQVKAIQIKAALELGSRLVLAGRQPEKQLIRTPPDAIALLEGDMQYLPREELRAIFLDIRNRVIRISRIATGSLSASVVYPRDVFREAVKANAAALILAHNHPSGDGSPSQEDIETTRRFIEMGEMMGVRVMDHLVIASGGSVSLKQQGLI